MKDLGAVKIWVYEIQNDFHHGIHFEAECEAIAIKTNVRELQGELIIFTGESKISVINQIKDKLQAMGYTGTLQIQK